MEFRRKKIGNNIKTIISKTFEDMNLAISQLIGSNHFKLRK